MTKDVVIEVIAGEQQCSQDAIKLETRLKDLGIDSLRAITILYQLEERLNIEIPNDLIDTIVTVNDIVSGIEKLRQNSDSGCQNA